jgi:hypothetical protein
VTVDWRKLQNEELHSLYSLPCVTEVAESKRIRYLGHGGIHGRNRKQRFLLKTLKALERRMKEKGNNKLDLREIVCGLD